jgi:hypothetical protein
VRRSIRFLRLEDRARILDQHLVDLIVADSLPPKLGQNLLVQM